MLETFICSSCGGERPITDCIQFRHWELCPDCRDSDTAVCSRCGDRIWLSENYGTESLILCDDCEDRYYDRCTGCGCLVDRDDLHFLSDDDYDGYCEACYNSRVHDRGVRSYCYKPEPIFYGGGLRYLGVELEIDDAGESDTYANQIQTVANQNCDHIYIKHDGSLDDGLEIVTHPMTLNYHCQEMPWQAVIRKALNLGYTSHQAETCGLHVHVNRSSLGYTYVEQEDTIARILFLVETFWNELLRFSRRTQKQMDKWASRYGRKDDPKDVLHTAKRSGDRYTCVNLTPYHPIEFRMFRGTLKYNTLIATLQMVEHLCSVAFSLLDNEAKDMTWSEFVSGISPTAMPELILYLKERRLYVNDPVAATEEV